jgi:hypothetical protein
MGVQGFKRVQRFKGSSGSRFGLELLNQTNQMNL